MVAESDALMWKTVEIGSVTDTRLGHNESEGGENMDQLFLRLENSDTVKIDHVTSDLHLSHRNIAQYAGRPFDNSSSTYHMDTALIKNWNDVVAEDDTVLCLGDMALGDMDVSIPMYSQMNGLKYLIPGNHDGNSSVMRKRYKKKVDKLQQWEKLYDNEFINLPETGVKLSLSIDGTEYHGFASHYPPHNDGHHGLNNGFADKFKDFRPPQPKRDEFVIHGHTYSKTIFDTTFKNVFHVGIDAHDLRPVSSLTVSEWFVGYLREI